MIVDAHTHIFEAGHGGPFSLPASADDLIRDMDAAGVDVSVVIPLPGIASNEFVQNECRRFPARIVPAYTPDFTSTVGAAEAMRRYCRDEKAHAVKIHPRIQNVTIADSQVLDVLDLAVELKLPVIFDVFPWGEMLDDPAISPLAFHRAAQAKPDLRLVLAHAGGFRLMDALMVAKSNANVFLEFSMTPVYFRGSTIEIDCGFACERLPPGRVMYGSDFPNVRLDESLTHARKWASRLNEPQASAFFGGAARDLYGI